MLHFRFQVCFCKNTATILTSITLATCDFVYRGPLFFVEFVLGFMLFYAALYDLCFAHFCLHLVMSIRICGFVCETPTGSAQYMLPHFLSQHTAAFCSYLDQYIFSVYSASNRN